MAMRFARPEDTECLIASLRKAGISAERWPDVLEPKITAPFFRDAALPTVSRGPAIIGVAFDPERRPAEFVALSLSATIDRFNK
jgi:hypothetical protein